MRTIVRVRSIGAIVLALALVIAACGGDDSGDAETSGSTVVEETAAAQEAEADPVEEAEADPVEEAELPSGTAGLVLLAPVISLEEAAAGFTSAAEACATADIEVIERNAEGDMPTVSQIIEGFVADEVDFIAPITTPAAQAAFQIVEAAGGTIPVGYSVVTDPFAAGLADDPSTHPAWISGSQSLPPFGAVLDTAQMLVPDLAIVGMPIAPAEANSEAVEIAIRAVAEERGVELVTASVTDSSEVAAAAEALVSRGAQVLIVPTISAVDAGQAGIAQVADDNDIPVVGSASSQTEGAAAVAVGADYFAAGVRAGEMACASISGTGSPADFDVINIEDPALSVSLANAEAQGVTIPDDILERAGVAGQ